MHPLKHVAAALAILGVLLAAAAPAVADPVLAAAGDIACQSPGTPSANACQQGATATLIHGASPDAVATLGDNQYLSGTAAEFSGGYDLTWGIFGSATNLTGAIVRPAPGNHEYDKSATASGYFGYFGPLAGPGTAGYYSYDLGAWHIVSLNSNCVGTTPCANYDTNGGGITSAEQSWLEADLQAHPGACTIAYWHHPLFSSSSTPGSPGVKPLWQTLYSHHADIVLNGHAHDYERFAPQDPDGQQTAAGVTEFVVGTGGFSHASFVGTQLPGSLYRDASNFGALFLTLHPGSYAWAFTSTGGQTLDSGTSSCHNWQPAAPAAPAASGVTAPAPATAVIPAATAGAAALLAQRFTGARLRAGEVTVRGGRVYLTESSALAAKGTLRLTALVRRLASGFERVSIGAGRFTIAARQTKRVAVRISRAGLALLARTARLRVTATATATDLLGQTATTRAAITLRAPRGRPRR